MSERGMSEQGAQATLGKLIGSEAKRDAVHIAVAPMIASVRLQRGQKIGFDGSDTTRAVPIGRCSEVVGIVDPFLESAVVQPGERFWMWLTPNTISGLRHEWTHPAFEAAVRDRVLDSLSDSAESREWIDNMAVKLGMSYADLMAAAKLWVDDEEYTTEYGSEHWRDTFSGNEREFWRHYEKVTGVRVKSPESFFSCAC